MTDIQIRQTGVAGRITLDRPDALNALTWEMTLAIEAALDDWAEDDAVHLVVLDATGERAFCAGGDLARLHAAMTAGDAETPRRFWRDEYRLNAKIARFPKPVVAFMQGHVLGGGVGIGCHASHRVVGPSTRIALPEASLGLVPDVGSTLLLARAPGRIGSYLGATGASMGPGDAHFAGFADHVLAEDEWTALIGRLEDTGDTDMIASEADPVPDAPLLDRHPEIDRLFDGDDPIVWADRLAATEGAFAAETLARLAAAAPLSVHAGARLVARARASDRIEDALRGEYRFCHRAAEGPDFPEGIRAAVIDKDRSPVWQHPDLAAVTAEEVEAALAPLGAEDLRLATPR